MLDPKKIRNDGELLAQALLKKKFVLDVERLSELDSKRKSLQLETEALQNERNQRSKSIGKAKAAGEDVSEILQSMEGIKQSWNQRRKN